MSNPFIMALKTNPDQFLGELDTLELRAVVEACIETVEKRAKAGDSAAPGALQAMYRVIANVEI